MNKTTFKKMAVLSTAAIFSSALLSAQQPMDPSWATDPSVTKTVETTTTTATDTMQVVDTTTTKMMPFSGATLKHFSLGANIGLSMPAVLGGTNLSNKGTHMGLGYGAYLEYSLNPWFSILASYQGGKLSGDYNSKEFKTALHYALAGKIRLSTGALSFLQRLAKVGLFAQAGLGYAGYTTDYDGYNDSRGNQFSTVGIGMNYNLTEALTLVIGYDMNYLASRAMYITESQVEENGEFPTSKWSYLYGGLELHFGGTGPACKWYNPIAVMYDQLKGGNGMQDKINAMSATIDNMDNRLEALFRDTDGDGVPDPYDREPNSAPGAVVDGAGRTIQFPDPQVIERVTRITEKEKQIIISLSKNIYFDTAKASLKAASFPKLNEVAKILRKNTCVKIRLDGHTDNTGKAEFNRKLSQDRVDSVKDYLVRQGGVNASQIEAKGWGQTKPLYSNKTKSGREKNRRVEVTIDDSGC